MTREELTEAKRQIASTVAKLEKVVVTLQAKEPASRYKSQITLAQRRVSAFKLALELIDRELEDTP